MAQMFDRYTMAPINRGGGIQSHSLYEQKPQYVEAFLNRQVTNRIWRCVSDVYILNILR